jgi:hypothetical protein
VALHLKELEYQYVEEDLATVESELFLTSNLVHGKDPVLLHDGPSASPWSSWSTSMTPSQHQQGHPPHRPT